jgi:isopenicillin-N N-acyltransferase-like protein
MDLEVVNLSGTPRAMGQAFGESCRAEVRELCDRRVRAAVKFAAERRNGPVTRDDVLAAAARCLPISRAWDPVGYEEFAGIAKGAGVDEVTLYAMQGLTDLRDLLGFDELAEDEGCSAFVVGNDRAEGGRMLVGQNWDLATDNMPFVRLVHRRPSDGPRTWSLTLTGCLTLIGINDAGLAVGNTNLKTTDNRPGVQYLAILHRAIGCTSLDAAAEAIISAPRLAAHFYYLADAAGRATVVECSGKQDHRADVTLGTAVRCNHAVSPAIRAIEAPHDTDSTCHRQARLEHLLQSHKGAIGVADLKAMLSDHDGGDRAICRHDVPPRCISTNASVIMCPASGQIHACRGQPHVGTWVTRAFVPIEDTVEA